MNTKHQITQTQIDWEYICTMMGNLSGIPIRIYRGRDLYLYHSVVKLPKDPVLFCLDHILSIADHIGYLADEFFYYYGIVVFGQMRIVIGPTSQGKISESELRRLAFLLDVSKDETEEFIQGMRSLVSLPLESLLQILCTINYLANGEQKHLSDIVIYEEYQQNIQSEILKEEIKKTALQENDIMMISHNTYSVEQTLLSMVRKGDLSALKTWLSHAPAIRSGIMANGTLRQLQNTFIVSATLLSRAAIWGGMDVEDAFSLSDTYISHCELLGTPEKIINLQFRMLMDYTERVNRIRHGHLDSQLAIRVSNYVQHHMSETITTDQIAAELFTSRTRLSANFHKETGETLSHFIMSEKIEEAKRLLRYSDRTITAIGEHLSFSSSGHFSRTFHKFSGMTPGEYRSKFTRG